jgi:hypothetical protein
MDANISENDLPRRNFFKKFLSSEREQQKPDEVTIGNLTCQLIRTEHDTKDWDQGKDTLLNQIGTSREAIFEYFPPEYRPNIYKDGVLTAIDFMTDEIRGNGLFYRLAEVLKEQNKAVWLVDPAYSAEFAYFRAIQYWPNILATGVAETGFIAAGIKNAVEQYSKMSRREFLLHLSAIISMSSAIPILGTFSFSIGHNKTEADFRRVHIANNLKVLGGKVEVGTKMPIVYPKAHFDGDFTPGILDYLNNENLLQEGLSKYRSYSENKYFGPLFKIRKWETENNEWKRTVEIDTLS